MVGSPPSRLSILDLLSSSQPILNWLSCNTHTHSLLPCATAYGTTGSTSSPRRTRRRHNFVRWKGKAKRTDRRRTRQGRSDRGPNYKGRGRVRIMNPYPYADSSNESASVIRTRPRLQEVEVAYGRRIRIRTWPCLREDEVTCGRRIRIRTIRGLVYGIREDEVAYGGQIRIRARSCPCGRVRRPRVTMPPRTYVRAQGRMSEGGPCVISVRR